VIFVRRDCDAEKIGAYCRKLLTAGTWENGVVRASSPYGKKRNIEIYPKAYQPGATDQPLSRRMMYVRWSLQNGFASNTSRAHPQINLFGAAG
jgi:hypothetical protein